MHRTGKGARFTKGKELTLIHTEFFSTRTEAMNREIEIKKMTKKQKKELIQGRAE